MARGEREERTDVRLDQEVWGDGSISQSVCDPSAERRRDVWEGGGEQLGGEFGEGMRGLTTHSTRPRDSISFIVALFHNVEGCSRGSG